MDKPYIPATVQYTTMHPHMLNSTAMDRYSLIAKDTNQTEADLDIDAISLLNMTFPSYGQPQAMGHAVLKLQKVVDWLRLYYTPSVIAIGLVGNFVSIVTLLRTQLASLPTARYLAACTLVDAVFLFSLLTTWLVEMGYPIYHVGVACHATTFAREASSFLSVWYTVCYSVDALIAIKFPNAERKMCTITKAKIVIMTLAIVATTVFLNISLTVGVVNLGPRQVCAPVGRFTDALRTLGHVDVFVNVLLPYSALVGIGVACAVQSYKDGLCQRHGPHVPPQRSVHMECDVESGLMCQYFAFIATHLILNLPLKLFLTMSAVGDMAQAQAKKTLKLFFIEETLRSPYNTKFALNFFIYLFAWRGFRGTLFLAFHKAGRRLIGIFRKRGALQEGTEWHFIDHALDESGVDFCGPGKGTVMRDET